MWTPGQTIELTIDKPVVGGRVMARSAHGVVLVAGAIPGERVVARIERATRDVAHATTVDVLDPASSRRAVSVDASCGGLAYAHIAYPQQVELKREVIADALRRIGRVELADAPRVTSSPEEGYRLRARFHVRGQRAGWFREGTRELCSPHGSGQVTEDALDAIDHLLERVPSTLVHGIDTIELGENLPGTARVLHVTPRPPAASAREPGARAWRAGHWGNAAGSAISGITWSRHRSDRVVTLDGVPWVTDPLAALVPGAHVGADLEVRRHAASFFQANRFVLPSLVEAVGRWVDKGSVVDLYAGVGLFALAACARGAEEVVAVEGDALSAGDLAENARPFEPRLRVVRDSVERLLASAEPIVARATLIVDPPRTGISRRAMDGIVATGAPRLVYVSCDVATFARDVRRLLDAGYALAHLEGFDLFPNTGHVEVLAVLDRCQPGQREA